MRVAITGFEPFKGFPVNPSGALAESLEVDGHEFVRSVLPVDFAKVRSSYPAWLAEQCPDAILNLGLSAKPGIVSPERLAVRFGVEPKPGEDQARWHELDGEPALETRVDTETLAESMRAAGVPAASSYHAGTYLCNFVYYQSLNFVAASRRALFVHVPFDTESAVSLSRVPEHRVPSLDGVRLRVAVALALEALTR